VRDGRVTPVAAAFEQRDMAAERARTVETWTTRGIVIWVVVFALIALVTVLMLRRRRHRQGAHPGTR
jgi:preprotein translocase subunit SecG